MRIALYKGKSLISRAIREWTRSDYSHAAFLFDEQTERVARQLALPKLKHNAAGSVVEAWHVGGVRNTASLSADHSRGTEVDVFEFIEPLTITQEEQLLWMLHDDIGKPYNFRHILKFLTRRDGKDSGKLFCSEQVFDRTKRIGRELLARTEAWRVPPDWIPRSTTLRLFDTIITT